MCTYGAISCTCVCTISNGAEKIYSSTPQPSPVQPSSLCLIPTFASLFAQLLRASTKKKELQLCCALLERLELLSVLQVVEVEPEECHLVETQKTGKKPGKGLYVASIVHVVCCCRCYQFMKPLNFALIRLYTYVRTCWGKVNSAKIFFPLSYFSSLPTGANWMWSFPSTWRSAMYNDKKQPLWLFRSFSQLGYCVCV